VGDEGALLSTNFEGIPVLTSYARSELSGWRVIVSIPLSALQAPFRQWRLVIAILCTVALALLIGLAFWFGRRIARPIHALEASAEQLAKGQPISPTTTGLREISAVSRALALASAELRERERALRESEERLWATYDNAAVGIIEVDQDERILQVNQTHCALMGLSRDELIGHSFLEPTSPDDRARDRQLFKQQVDGKLPIYTVEKQHIRGDGSVRWARVSSTAVHDAAGRFAYAIRVVEDITERKQAEIALRELNLTLERRVEARTREIERMGEANRRAAIIRERLRMARDLHDTLAHSLLALLSQIRLIRKLMGRDPAAVEAELARAEEAAHEGLAQARAAVEELRYQAIGEEGLGPALERLAARLRAKTSLEITLHVDPAATGLEDGQAEVLYRIAEEAVHNVERHSAAEHMDVSVRVDRLNGAGHLTLTVADNGAGFDPGAVPSGHYGLLGMREQAALIGAELRVDSAPGQGTRVSVSVPV
jgi:PAS domain S-box-containing protein